MADRGLIVFFETEAETCREYQPAVYIPYAGGARKRIEQAFETTKPEFTDDTDRAAAQLVIAYAEAEPQIRFVKTDKLLKDPEFYSPGDQGLFLVYCHRDCWKVVRHDHPICEAYTDDLVESEYTLERPDAQVSQTSSSRGSQVRVR